MAPESEEVKRDNLFGNPPQKISQPGQLRPDNLRLKSLRELGDQIRAFTEKQIKDLSSGKSGNAD